MDYSNYILNMAVSVCVCVSAVGGVCVSLADSFSRLLGCVFLCVAARWVYLPPAHLTRLSVAAYSAVMKSLK